MTARAVLVGFGILAIGVCLPAAAAAQQGPVAAVAPWRSLDFGKPTAPVASEEASKRGAHPTVLRHGGAHAPDALHQLMGQSDTPACSTALRHTHSEANWFGRALPPLPAAPPVQPFLGHGHRLLTPLETIPPSCKGA
ncbi:MAG TPA: hypothetical protein VFV78_07990 [Vicinamibacterales bacterium]|nr:hypothetical protein [Vicinamibacterales bacterium]